jgi:hypothetical protein
VAQGVSSDLTGVTGSPSERTNAVQETPNGLTNLDLRNTLHPVVTGSAFHRTGAAADKDEYPWFHEFGIPVGNDATVYGLFLDVQKHLASRERGEQVPHPAGAFAYKFKNNRKGLMVSIPTSKSRTGENKLVAAVKTSIAWATRGNSDAMISTVKALLSELAESNEKEYIEVGVDKHLCLPFKEIDAITAVAMAEQANINTTSMCTKKRRREI